MTMQAEMPFHWTCTLFPAMSESEFEALKSDIEANGQLEPILIWEGQIIDGRNRYLACRALGIEPNFEPVADITDERAILTRVLSKNTKRRHLTTSQAALVALDINKATAVGGEPISLDRAAEAVGVSPSLVHMLSGALKKRPELRGEVAAGKITVNAASDLAKVADREPKVADRAIDRVRKARSKKEAKHAVSEATHGVREPKKTSPARGKLTDISMPGKNGVYATLVAIAKGIDELPSSLRGLPAFVEANPLAPTHARQLMRSLKLLTKVDAEALAEAAEEAIDFLKNIANRSDEEETETEQESQDVSEEV